MAGDGEFDLKGAVERWVGSEEGLEEGKGEVGGVCGRFGVGEVLEALVNVGTSADRAKRVEALQNVVKKLEEKETTGESLGRSGVGEMKGVVFGRAGEAATVEKEDGSHMDLAPSAPYFSSSSVRNGDGDGGEDAKGGGEGGGREENSHPSSDPLPREFDPSRAIVPRMTEFCLDREKNVEALSALLQRVRGDDAASARKLAEEGWEERGIFAWMDAQRLYVRYSITYHDLRTFPSGFQKHSFFSYLKMAERDIKERERFLPEQTWLPTGSTLLSSLCPTERAFARHVAQCTLDGTMRVEDAVRGLEERVGIEAAWAASEAVWGVVGKEPDGNASGQSLWDSLRDARWHERNVRAWTEAGNWDLSGLKLNLCDVDDDGDGFRYSSDYFATALDVRVAIGRQAPRAVVLGLLKRWSKSVGSPIVSEEVSRLLQDDEVVHVVHEWSGSRCLVDEFGEFDLRSTYRKITPTLLSLHSPKVDNALLALGAVTIALRNRVLWSCGIELGRILARVVCHMKRRGYFGSLIWEDGSQSTISLQNVLQCSRRFPALAFLDSLVCPIEVPHLEIIDTFGTNPQKESLSLPRLEPFPASPTLRALRFSEFDLTSPGIAKVVESLGCGGSLPVLQTLLLSNFSDFGKMSRLIDAMVRPGALPSLLHLDVTRCNLCTPGSCPLLEALARPEVWPRLRSLNLRRNRLGGVASILDEAIRHPGTLQKLESLNLAENLLGRNGAFRSTLDAVCCLGALPSLRSLDLSWNSGELDDTSSCLLAPLAQTDALPLLESLDLTRNGLFRLGEQFLSILVPGVLPSLSSLAIDSSDAGGSPGTGLFVVLGQPGVLPALQSLTLHGWLKVDLVEERGITLSPGSFPSFRKLNLSSIDGPRSASRAPPLLNFLAEHEMLSSLVSLNLDLNYFGEIRLGTPWHEPLCRPGVTTSLCSLSLRDNGLDFSDLSWITALFRPGNFPSLYSLDLHGNSRTRGAPPDHLIEALCNPDTLPKLRMLDLSDNWLGQPGTDAFSAALRHPGVFMKLRVLHFDGCDLNLTTTLIETLGTLPSLRSLNLGGRDWLIHRKKMVLEKPGMFPSIEKVNE